MSQSDAYDEAAVARAATVIANSPLVESPKLPPISWEGLARAVLDAALAGAPPTTKPNSNARPPISPSGGNGRPSHTTPQPSSDAEALKHDLSRAISNHAADLSQPSGEPWDRLAYRQSFRAQGSQPSSEARAVALLRAALAYIPEETITHNEQLLEARSYIATLPPNGDKESR